MVYRNLGVEDVIKLAKDKTLICFGAGQQLASACEYLADMSFFDRIDLIADNDNSKRAFSFNGKEKPVSSIEYCLKTAKKEPLVLITVADCLDIVRQLDEIPELDNCECYVYALLLDYVRPYRLPVGRAEKESIKIPKTIHYCWFGGGPLRDDFKAYIETWKRHCPDYEIVRWDESSYDYKKNEHMCEAYKHKKWGFVPDYARLDIIYNYGGVYLDTDVELIRNIDDLLCDEAFCGFNYRTSINNGVGFGAVAGFPLILDQLNAYDSLSFVNQDGSLNLKTGPSYQTELMLSKGLVLNNTLQIIDGMTVYPSDVLSPLGLHTGWLSVTDNTHSIHHHSLTWLEKAQHTERDRVRKRFDSLAERIGV